MPLAAWLLSIAGPLVIRALAALGFTTVVFTGVELLVQQLIVSAQDNWNLLPFTVLQIASIGGVPEALGLVMGAYVAKFSMQAAVGAAQYVFKPK